MALNRKAGDTADPLRLCLTDNEAPVDLTEATITLTILKPDGVTLTKTVTKDAGQATTPTEGDLTGRGWIQTAAWLTTDTDVEGDYLVEANVLWSDTTTKHFPGLGTARFTVESTLA